MRNVSSWGILVGWRGILARLRRWWTGREVLTGRAFHARAWTSPAVHKRGRWRRILHRDPCAYCGRPSGGTLDHIVARRDGGRLLWQNLTGSCRACNVWKGHEPLVPFLIRRHRRISALPPALQRIQGQVTRRAITTHAKQVAKVEASIVMQGEMRRKLEAVYGEDRG